MAKRIIIIIVFLSLVLVGIRLISGCGSGGGQGGTTVSTTSTTPSGTHGLTKIFFLHQSTGQGLINNYDPNTPIVRPFFTSYNSTHGANFKFWDYWGSGDNYLIDPTGTATGINLYDPNFTYSQTDPESLYWTWTGSDNYWVTVRDRIVGSFEVIAFKSCFGASNIANDEELQQRKTWYLAMRDFFDTRRDRLFVVMSFAPIVPAVSNATMANYARAFAKWLNSSEFFSAAHPNVVVFDLFDYLASPDGSGAEANMLRPDYRLADPADSHPNTLANQTVGPIFAQYLINAALNY